MQRRQFLSIGAALGLAAAASRRLAAADDGNATDWPHWRGPNRNDIVKAESGFREGQWPLEPLWQRRVGIGSTSPLVVGDRLFTMGWNADQDIVYCLDAVTGKTLWSEKYPAPRFGRHAVGDQGLYAGPTSTPEYDRDTGTLYSLSCDGRLIAWQATEGRQLWSKNLYHEYGMQQRPQVGRSGRRDYGYTTAPLVYGDQLLVEVGGSAGTIVSLDKRTGKQLWGSADRDFAGHTGGLVPLRIDGVDCAAVLSFSKLLVVRLDEGRAGQTVAEYPWKTEFANNIASPGVSENSLILTSGYNLARTVRVDLTLAGAQEIWRSEHYSKICTPVVAHDRVYFCWNTMVCLDFATGKLLWQGGRTGDAGSLILTGDERLIALVDRGELLLVDSARHSPDRYSQLAHQGRLLGSDAWPHVVLAGRHIYCKGREGELVCLKIGGA